MTVSIIIPVYNVEPYLPRCVESILAQTYTDWELILVDDGSPDRCPEMCDAYAASDKRIKVIHKVNGGLSDARNHGLDAATGDYILFVDSDDYIHPHMLQTMTRLAKEKDADIVQCSYIRGASNSFPTIEEKALYHLFDNKTIFSSTKQHTILCAKLYRRILWDGLRMPIGKVHEDDFTTWKLYYRSQRTVTTDTPYYYYYKNPRGIMASEARRFNPVLVEAYDERISFFEKHGEDTLATLSRWRFCMPLMYLHLRGNMTEEEKHIVLHLLYDNIKKFVCCRQVPWTHRLVFVFLGLVAHPLRLLLEKIGKAHVIDFTHSKT